MFLAVLLEFIFRDSEFPWGGAFGESVSGWMENFVGTVGMIVLFFFIIFNIDNDVRYLIIPFFFVFNHIKFKKTL